MKRKITSSNDQPEFFKKLIQSLQNISSEEANKLHNWLQNRKSNLMDEIFVALEVTHPIKYEKLGPYDIPVTTSKLARDVLSRLHKEGVVGFRYDSHGPSEEVAQELNAICQKLGHEIHDSDEAISIIDWEIFKTINGYLASEKDCEPMKGNHEKSKNSHRSATASRR